MQRGGVEADVAERLPATLIFALEVRLGDQLAGSQHEQAVNIRVLAGANLLDELRDRGAIDANRLRRCRWQFIARSHLRSDGEAQEQGSQHYPRNLSTFEWSAHIALPRVRPSWTRAGVAQFKRLRASPRRPARVRSQDGRSRSGRLAEVTACSSSLPCRACRRALQPVPRRRCCGSACGSPRCDSSNAASAAIGRFRSSNSSPSISRTGITRPGIMMCSSVLSSRSAAARMSSQSFFVPGLRLARSTHGSRPPGCPPARSSSPSSA